MKIIEDAFDFVAKAIKNKHKLYRYDVGGKYTAHSLYFNGKNEKEIVAKIEAEGQKQLKRLKKIEADVLSFTKDTKSINLRK